MKAKPRGTKIPGFICYVIGHCNGKFRQYAIIEGEYKSRLTAKILKNFDSYVAEEVTLLSERTKNNIQKAKSFIDRRLELEQQPKSKTDLIENFRRDDEISYINKQLAMLHSELDSALVSAKEKILGNSTKYEYLLTSYYSGLSKSGFDIKSCKQRINISSENERNQALEIYRNGIGKYLEELNKFIGS